MPSQRKTPNPRKTPPREVRRWRSRRRRGGEGGESKLEESCRGAENCRVREEERLMGRGGESVADIQEMRRSRNDLIRVDRPRTSPRQA